MGSIINVPSSDGGNPAWYADSSPPPLPDGAGPEDTWEPGCKWHYLHFHKNTPYYGALSSTDFNTMYNQLIANGWQLHSVNNGMDIYARKWICPGECWYVN